ncbi:D-glycero-beta-D-manno-heptose 1,7-bisphosphate 7-phosphatase [Aliiglaciecola sp. CAU 1673]|uniref:D-glycero-beta-D-manno-heptose 1,7-bisphosphate 7-phosphatase n=1 Tax=Aliiglaciecola sp. CAU 1673 TaxID=3032595 RepID=UPI0023DA6ADD|nr:D-glycero-beta-D-manno-heptose 1,7-bisphosphate 7-phosphatase [Aliiglaciecola sp. CAU 1673]MDF2177695.1 D-glycero-beta-D-manno-heptose 1,7-bisphosphate 7-phosphatase [Aliiglaciecola sp. CAU 1673]
MDKAAFLDRDGIINVDHGYVSSPEQFDFMEGIFELCAALKQKGYKLVVVTNQSGIGRGYYSEQSFWQLSDWMREQFEAQGIVLDGIYFCPHHPSDASGEYRCECQCRKPAPGMLLKAAEELDLALSQSLMIGDKQSDMEAAKAAGLKGGFLLTEATGGSDPFYRQVSRLSAIAPLLS